MDIRHDEEKKWFSVEVDGVTAHVSYLVEDGALIVDHTIVPKEIGGRGIAGALVKAAHEFAAVQGLRFEPTCSYAVKWAEKNLS